MQLGKGVAGGESIGPGSAAAKLTRVMGVMERNGVDGPVIILVAEF